MENFLERMIFWCGLAHFALCLGSLYIPNALQWRKHLVHLEPLLRQMFWTYAGYILVTNLCFGVVSVLGSKALLDNSFLAASITFFIGVYWLSRIAIQFFYFDRSTAPKGFFFTLGEIILVLLFAAFALTYLTAFLYNVKWI